jgi:hypothetical protein
MNEVISIEANTLPAQASEGRALTPASASPAGSLLNFIASALENPSIDVTKLQALLDMQRQVVADEATALFNQALASMSAEMPQIEKNGIVELKDQNGRSKGKYNFARWEDMDAVLRPLMAKHGFTLSFNSKAREGGGAIVVGRLLHAGGHSETAEVALALDSGPGRNNLQALGSTLSYGKRYLAEMLMNLVRKGSDDDGNFGGTDFIDAAKCREIEDLLAKTKTDRARFLQHFNIADVPNIADGEQFVQVKNTLQTKLAKMKPAGDDFPGDRP